MATTADGGFTTLIEAFEILRHYADPYAPTHCEHDVLMIVGVDPDEVSEEDKARLEALGFFIGNEYGDEAFLSYRFGSA